MTINTNYARFELPQAVQARLQLLLDRQDSGLSLSDAEKYEAAELVEIAEFLSLLHMRAERVEQRA